MIQAVYDRDIFLAPFRQRGWRTKRHSYISSVAYTESAPTELRFFGKGFRDTNKELDNLPVAGRFDGPFLLQSISLRLKIKNWSLLAFAGDDLDTLASDLVMGFPWAGVFTFNGNGEDLLKLPQPLLEMPDRAGEFQVKSAGVRTLTLTEATPNTLLSVITPAPFAHIATDRAFSCDPLWFIDEGDPLDVSLRYPAGAVHPIATDITDDSTNPLYVQCLFHGELLTQN
ncbi:MAG: hypothetical protein AB1705_21530 [Verrucomicrobiota bacterium]